VIVPLAASAIEAGKLRRRRVKEGCR